VSTAAAHAKLNLTLVVGPVRPDGLHELATVYQRLDLHDTIELEPAATLGVEGFLDDTLVRRALEAVAAAAHAEPRWHVRIEKRIPVAAGLGGGSSDAAAALELANTQLDEPLAAGTLHELARSLGSDVPFFLRRGAHLGTGDGTELEPVDLPRDYAVVLVLPAGEVKESTGAVYARFDRARGFDERKAQLLDALARRDLVGLPPNDLASSPFVSRLAELGAFRADVTGAGPAVYGLFPDRTSAERAAEVLAGLGQTLVAEPAW
jgi:4-diphosphocytidyl-2-C-methyl-D-erythritol kinase